MMFLLINVYSLFDNHDLFQVEPGRSNSQSEFLITACNVQMKLTCSS